ncbi:uncharacterized protein BXZ73DRAFT_107957 [Epithele typhae]|uniref:uncharacterized protein n=1 Tax=Epithele typhae TaxID=378194 RepID=UPI00200800C6|nr:uncharacterized protein BXZ73DRAFT_107957 [Epithele typhae]KAH9911477.1 hypothetical protein BXZ73DRAFT_107957 [Epithele typhae]
MLVPSPTSAPIALKPCFPNLDATVHRVSSSMKLWRVMAVVLTLLSPFIYILVPYVRFRFFLLKHPQNPHENAVLASVNNALVASFCSVVFPGWSQCSLVVFGRPQPFCGSLELLPSTPAPLVALHSPRVTPLKRVIDGWPSEDSLDFTVCQADKLATSPSLQLPGLQLKPRIGRACSSLRRSLENTAFIAMSVDLIYEVYLTGFDVMDKFGMPAATQFISCVRTTMDDDSLKFLRIMQKETAIAKDAFNKLHVAIHPSLENECDSNVSDNLCAEVLRSVDSITTWLNKELA